MGVSPISNDRKLRILITESNPLVVMALSDMIRCDGRFELVGQLQAGEDFLGAISRDDLQFDVAVIGWKLADMTGGAILSELRRRKLSAPLVVFSSEQDTGILKTCLRLGAMGFCYQFDDPKILLNTLVAVGYGRICVPSIDLTKLNETPLSKLTQRELELMAAVSNGWTNLQIATRTGISENTVKYHLKNLYEKLGVKNRATAISLFAGEKQYF